MTPLPQPTVRPATTRRASRPVRAARLVLLNSLGAAYWLPKRWRLRLYRICGLDVADCTIFSGTIIRTHQLSIGAGSFINHSCLFGDGDITIGQSVFIGFGTTLASSDHLMGPSEKRAGVDVDRPITIEDGVWIGANSVVLGGVVIRQGCVIGAGAVVTKSTEPDGVYVGVPARRVRDL